MQTDIARDIIKNVLMDLSAGDKVTFAFQGGEPTLAGLSFFEGFFETVDSMRKNVDVDYAFQTNGLVIDEDWCGLLKSRPVLVGLSIDGEFSVHDQNRKASDGAGTYKRVMQVKRLFEQHGIKYNILSVLTNSSARHPQKMWGFITKENIEHIQFIPCLDELDTEMKSPYRLEPARFYSFYKALFGLWSKSLREGKYISVKFFDDLANLLLYDMPTSCGMTGQCSLQYVIESDGSVYPCDFYVFDSYCMGSLKTNLPSEVASNGAPFLASGREYAGRSPCVQCHYLNGFCGGGCKRLIASMYISNGICWYAKLLDELSAPMAELLNPFRFRQMHSHK
jgi:uncharacterized protein